MGITLAGVAYEVDLCELHRGEWAQVEAQLAAYVAVGRPVGQPAGKPRSAKHSEAAKAREARTRAVREWARANGHEVGNTGRVPAELVAAYELAQQDARVAAGNVPGLAAAQELVEREGEPSRWPGPSAYGRTATG